MNFLINLTMIFKKYNMPESFEGVTFPFTTKISRRLKVVSKLDNELAGMEFFVCSLHIGDKTFMSLSAIGRKTLLNAHRALVITANLKKRAFRIGWVIAIYLIFLFAYNLFFTLRIENLTCEIVSTFFMWFTYGFAIAAATAWNIMNKQAFKILGDE